jgi:hypothetical protein
MDRQALTEQTMNVMRDALVKPSDDVLRTFVQPATAVTGLIGYDLEPVAKHLFPVITPLRNKIPRDVTGFGTQANWQIIDQINPANVHMGVSEGNRGGAIGYHTRRALAAYVEYGLENWVTTKADLASKNFMDLKAEAQLQLLWSLMIQEEFCDLGGVGITALGQTPTPTMTDVGSGGSLANATTYRVACVALTLAGYQQLAGWNMGLTGQTLAANLATGLIQSSTRTNVDGSSDTINGGVAIPSAVAVQLTGAANDSITATVTPVAGAVAYAWYLGVADNAHMYLHSVTAASTKTFTAVASPLSQPFSALDLVNDYSVDSLVYDGMISQITNVLNGAYVQNVNGLLTTDGAGGVTQLNIAFSQMYDLYRLGIDELYVSSKELIDLNALVIANGAAPLIRYTMDIEGHGTGIDAGVVIATILNPVVNKKVKVIVHPNMPQGTMLGWSNSVPYPLNDVGQIVKKKMRRDYWSIEWPMVRRRYEYGIYADGVLQCYAPFAFCVINCIVPHP